MPKDFYKYLAPFVFFLVYSLLSLAVLKAQPLHSISSQLNNSDYSLSQNAIPLSNMKLGSGRLGDEVFFSAKFGYHFPFQQYDIEGIPGGLTFDGSAEFDLGKSVYAGANLEYWNSSNWVSIPGYTTQIERENSAWSYSFSLKIRKDIGIVNIVLGGLIGNCMMTSSSVNGGTEGNYFSVAFLFGLDIYVSRRLAISFQAEYRSLNRWEDTHKSFLEFKIGPSFILK